jgi:hypothetical protein
MKQSELYNQKDTGAVREYLLVEQDGKCALTGLPLEKTKAVLDHAHDDTHFVRGVLHRSVNSCLGVVENAWKRHMKWWYNGTLPDFLRKVADYLDKEPDMRYIHPGWLKACGTRFNSLSEGQKKEVLKSLARPEGVNAKERKEIFRKALLSRQFTLTQIEYIIQQVKT